VGWGKSSEGGKEAVTQSREDKMTEEGGGALRRRGGKTDPPCTKKNTGWTLKGVRI